jgi:anti-anti-sigma factor
MSPTSMRPGALSVEDFACDGVHTWVLTGRLDRGSAAAFTTMTADLCAERADGLVVDLGNLTYIDPTGLTAVVRARRMCEANDCSFSLAPLSRAFNLPAKRQQARREAMLQGERIERPAPARRVPAGRRSTRPEPALRPVSS